jgi:hypothetical protein
MMFFIDLRDRWNRAVTAEVTIRRDTVEIRCRETIVGITDRELLRDWLRRPEGVLAYDELAWLTVGNGVALAIDDIVPAWVLAEHVLVDLRQRV